MAAVCVVIVHDHGVQAKHNDRRSDKFEPPYEKLLQKPAEQKYPCPSKGVEKPLDLMGGRHVSHCGFDDAGISIVFCQLVKPGQPAARAVRHEAKDLFEQFNNAKAFRAFSNRSKPPFNPWIKADLAQICDKKRQSGPAGEPVFGGLDSGYFPLALLFFPLLALHVAFHLLGAVFVIIGILSLTYYNKRLPKNKRPVFTKNRSA
jgi:hypothetical protein